MIWIKICATTNLPDAQASLAAGADALGFIFAPSSRQIEVEQAAEIISSLTADIEKIGVFVNQTPAQVAEIAEQAGLTGIQLHGDEPADEMEQYRQALGQRKIIKTLQARELLNSPESLDGYLRSRQSIDAILLDAGSPSQRGGTGQTFDWTAAAPIVARVRAQMPVIIAGGLNSRERRRGHPLVCALGSGCGFGRRTRNRQEGRSQTAQLRWRSASNPGSIAVEGTMEETTSNVQSSDGESSARQAGQAAACACRPGTIRFLWRSLRS